MRNIFILMGATFFIAACTFTEPTRVHPEKITVEDRIVATQYTTADLTDDTIKAIAHDVTRKGDESGLSLSVLYDPRSSRNNALTASQLLSQQTRRFRAAGLQNMTPGIVPIKDFGHTPKILVQYRRYTAKPPEGCTTMAGFADNNIEIDPKYGLGCTVDTAFTRQIVRPRDLLGRGAAPENNDGRRAGNLVDPIRAGIPNEPLDGETASDTN